MQKDKTEAEQKLSISNYQQSLMSTCMELIDAWTSQPHSDQATPKIKLERAASPEQNNWASGSSSAISNKPTKETQFAVKQEIPSGKHMSIVFPAWKYQKYVSEKGQENEICISLVYYLR